MAGSYAPGDGLAVVTPALAVLLPGGDAPTAREVHATLARGAGATQVLQVIAAGGGGFGEWPAFAVVAWGDAGAQVFVRGDVAVRVEGAAGVVTVDGTDVFTWREERVEGATRCEVGLDVPSDALPIASGVVRASGIVLVPGDEPGLPAPPAPAVDRADRPTARPVPVVDEPSVVAPAADAASVPDLAPASDAEPASGPAPAPEAAHAPGLISDVPGIAMTASTLAAYTASTLPDSPQQVLPEIPSRPSAAGAAAPAGEPEPDENGYDHLWGMTRKGRVEDAAIRLEPEEGHGEGAAAAAGPGHGSDLAAPPPSGVGADDPLHDGMTIGPAAMAELRRARAAQAAPGPQLDAPAFPGGHGVLARVCLSGHANPPERSECWVCGRQVSGEASRRSRPPLGRLRLATGEVVELDGPYVVGRRPKISRVQGEVPRVLAVPSPEGEVSASHLALRLEDWHVLAEDQSRNGTVLYREGEDPRRLQPHVPMIMRSGDVLDLGDGAVLTFEGLP